MAAAAILHFRKSGILGYSNLDMANVYPVSYTHLTLPTNREV